MEDEDDIEVYRVAVVGKPKPEHYEVFCIDYGDKLTVHHKQLRFLRKEFLHRLEAQCISCSLYNVASPKKISTTGEDVWSNNVCDYARNIFLPNDTDLPTIKVHFKSKLSTTGKWLVKGSAPPAIPDFGEAIMTFVNKKK